LVTYVGRGAEMRVDWLAPPAARDLVVGTAPGGRHDLTVVVTETADILHVAITFYSDVYSRAHVGRALELLLNPLRPLEEFRSHRVPADR
jgi:hypothetical protein